MFIELRCGKSEEIRFFSLLGCSNELKLQSSKLMSR
jgi:hypothetical protein